MRIVSVEPTPNPHNMKLNLDPALPPGVSYEFTPATAASAPAHLRQVLAIPGVTGVYQVAGFLAVARHPKADWQVILAAVVRVLAPADDGAVTATPPAVPNYRPADAVEVFLQMFRGLPMQVKLRTPTEEARFALPERFAAAAREAVAAAPSLFAERHWVPRGVRYGALAEIGAEVVEQVSVAYGEERLQRLLAQALTHQPGAAPVTDFLPPDAVAAQLDDGNWQVRYAALDRLDPTPESLPVLVKALADPHSAVRRLAVVYLGALSDAAVLPYLTGALQDPAVAVRRAAGDCLSDLGDPAANAAMAAALADASSLVRWRAARFLFEVGDATALPALRAAASDPEFEVRLQVEMAIERIAGGAPASGPAWKQMTR